MFALPLATFANTPWVRANSEQLQGEWVDESKAGAALKGIPFAVVPLTLMPIGHLLGDPRAGLTVIQTATLAFLLPILLVGVLMSISLANQLAKDQGLSSGAGQALLPGT